MDRGLVIAAAFCAACFFMPIIMFVVIVYGLVFFVGGPLCIILWIMNQIGFHYIWLHYGLFGCLGYGALIIGLIYGVYILLTEPE